MSRNTSPGHRFSGAFDNFYDPDYTVQISSKMQVPNKISVIEGVENKENVTMEQESGKMIMLVPDRILLTGGNEHVETRDPLPEVRLESAILPQPSTGIGLSAPPRVLTLDEYSYPAVDEKPSIPAKDENHVAPHSADEVTYSHDSTVSVAYHPEEEVALLRKQVKFLSRRISQIEQINQQRLQREMILYSTGILYFLLKGIFWLHRHF